MPKISIDLSKKELEILKKRSKGNLMSIKKEVEDIVRRSNIISKAKPKRKAESKIIFSQEKLGGYKRKKNRGSILNKG